MKKLILPFLALVFLYSCNYWDDYEKVEIDETEFSKCETITDERDGKIYQTVWIDEDGGNDLTKNGQCWMKENLNYDLNTNAGEIGKKICYQAEDYYCENYGGLYNRYATIQGDASEKARGICPKGFHIPSEEDFSKLIASIGIDNATFKLTVGVPNATNSSKFTSLLSGVRSGGGSFFYHIIDVSGTPEYPIGAREYYWTSTVDSNSGEVKGFVIRYDTTANFARTENFIISENLALSIRCICDE